MDDHLHTEGILKAPKCVPEENPVNNHISSVFTACERFCRYDTIQKLMPRIPTEKVYLETIRFFLVKYDCYSFFRHCDTVRHTVS